MNRARHAALLTVLLAASTLACKTEVKFKNGVPRATIENARWVTDDGNEYAAKSGDALEPGQTSEAILIPEGDEDDTGHIEFELVVDGRKVALTTESSFQSKAGETTEFELTPSTAATNPLASQVSDTKAQPAGQ